MVKKSYITLKWGTLKSWNVEGNEKAIKLLREYLDIGASASAMTQKDTPRQKEIICQLIDVVPGEVYLDWEGVYVSKEAAKKYVIEYGNN